MQNRHHLELTWLEDCIALADTLNFSKAAACRYVTQPAFSRRIQSLEEWVGAALFERNRRGVRLTPAGEIFCQQAPDLIRSLYSLKTEALDAAGQEQPDTIFSATHALSFSFFPELLRGNDKIARFGSFRLLSDTLRACERIMIQGGSQFLLCHYHPHMRLNLDPEKFMSIGLGLDRLIPYSITANGSSEPLWPVANKKKFPYLSFSDESGLGRIISNTASTNRAKRGMEVVFTSDLAATLLAMVRAGDGVAWLPETLAEQDVKSGNITAASSDADFYIPVEIRLYRPAAKMSKSVEELWRIFVEGRRPL